MGIVELVLSGLGGLLAFLLATELGLRAADGVPLFTWSNFIVARTRFLDIHTAARYEPQLGWVAKDGLTGNVETWVPKSRTTGRHGIRLNRAVQNPLDVPLPKGAIIACGDSFTFGSDVGDNESWPAHLERILGEPVLNAATGGWGTDQIVLRSEMLTPTLEPRLVIASFLYEDMYRSTTRTCSGINKPFFLIEDGKLTHYNNPVPLGSGRLSDLDPLRRILGFSYTAIRVLQGIGRSDLTRVPTDLSNDVVPEHLSALLVKRLKDFLDERGVRLLVVLQFGSRGHFHDRRKPFGMATRFLDAIRGYGVEWVNTWYVMHDIYARQPETYAELLVTMPDGSQGHLSSKGNQLVAELISETIRGNPRPETQIS